MGRRQGKSMGGKTKTKQEKEWSWPGFNFCQLANNSLKAVLSMESPSVM